MAQLDDKFNPSFGPDIPKDVSMARHITPAEPQKVADRPVEYNYIGLGGEGVGDFIKAADESVKKNIELGAYTDTDTANTTRLNIDMDQAGYGGTAPKELTDQEKKIGKLNRAYNSGAMPESQYYAFLYKKSQDMKDRYGIGYYGYIDEMYDRAASHLTLASKLDNALRSQMSEAQGSKNKWDEWQDKNKQWLSYKYGPTWKEQLDSGKISPEKAQQDVGNVQASKLALESSRLELEARKATEQDAYDKYSALAMNSPGNSFNRMSAATGEVTEQQIYDEVNLARTKYAGDAGYLAQLREHMSTYKQQEMQAAKQEVYAIDPKTKKSMAMQMGPEYTAKYLKDKEEYIDGVTKLYTDEQFGVATMLVKNADTGIDNAAARQKINSEDLQVMLEADKSMPGYMKNMTWDNPHAVNFANDTISNLFFNQVATGKRDSVNFKDSEANPALVHHNLVANVNDPKMPEQARRNIFESYIDSKSAEFHANVKPEESSDASKNEGLNKQKAMGKVINANTVQDMYTQTAGKGDVQGWEKIKSETLDTVATNAVMDVRHVESMITSSFGKADVRWNPQTQQLEIANEAQLTGYDKNMWRTARKSLKALNMDLAQVGSVFKAEGQSDDEVAASLYKYVTDQSSLGLDVNAPHGAPFWAPVFQRQEDTKGAIAGIPTLSSEHPDLLGGAGAASGEGFIQRTRDAMMRAGLGDVPANDNQKVIEGGKTIVDKATTKAFTDNLSKFDVAGQQYLMEKGEAYRKVLEQEQNAIYTIQTSNSPTEKMMALHERDSARALANRFESQAHVADAEEKAKSNPLSQKLQRAKDALEKEGFRVIHGGLPEGAAAAPSGGVKPTLVPKNPKDDLLE